MADRCTHGFYRFTTAIFIGIGNESKRGKSKKRGKRFAKKHKNISNISTNKKRYMNADRNGKLFFIKKSLLFL
jgi:hypothetical protein